MSRSRRRLLRAGTGVLAVVGITLAARAAFDEYLEAPLTFTGRLQGVDQSDATLRFDFSKTGASCASTARTPLDADGRFSVTLDTSTCAGDFFSGGSPPNVTITITDPGNVVVVDNVPVGAVPFARFADNARSADTAAHLAEADCPVGYVGRDNASVDECFRAVGAGEDVVVKVGTGNTSFWMDRYEAIVVNASNTVVLDPNLSLDGTGRSLLDTDRALSTNTILPRTNVSWFEASTLCRNAGKRLPRRAEWLYAARHGTDPDDCNVDGPIVLPGTSGCRSEDGVEDLYGNVQEYMEEWVVGSADDVNTSVTFGDEQDRVFNISGQVINIEGQAPVSGLPAVEIRGGADAGTAAGYLFGGADRSPLNRSAFTGFRCVIPR